jgi:hypothetical protein
MLDYLKAIKLPAVLLGLILFFELLAFCGVLPTQGDLIGRVGHWLSGAGVWAVFLLSAIENIVGFNTYIPGSIAILTAMASTGGHPGKAFEVWFAITSGAFLGQIASYCVGLAVLKKWGSTGVPVPRFKTFALTFWHPQFAAITSSASGASGQRVHLYLAQLGFWLTMWNIFWGLTMYFFGSKISLSDTGSALAVLYLIGWICYEFWRVHRARLGG